MAVTVAPLTTTVMNSVGAELAGVASGVNNAVSRAAGLLAIAVFGIVMAQGFDATLSRRLAERPLAAPLQASVEHQRQKLAGIELPPGTTREEADAARAVIAESFVAGFRRVMLLCAGLALLSAFAAWRFIGARGKAPALTPPRSPPT